MQKMSFQMIRLHQQSYWVSELHQILAKPLKKFLGNGPSKTWLPQRVSRLKMSIKKIQWLRTERQDPFIPKWRVEWWVSKRYHNSEAKDSILSYQSDELMYKKGIKLWFCGDFRIFHREHPPGLIHEAPERKYWFQAEPVSNSSEKSVLTLSQNC